jgi:hypothetical protein
MYSVVSMMFEIIHLFSSVEPFMYACFFERTRSLNAEFPDIVSVTITTSSNVGNQVVSFWLNNRSCCINVVDVVARSSKLDGENSFRPTSKFFELTIFTEIPLISRIDIGCPGRNRLSCAFFGAALSMFFSRRNYSNNIPDCSLLLFI